MAQIYTRAGGETLLNATAGGNQQYSHLSALSSGGFVGVWKMFGFGQPLRGHRFDAAGARQGDEFTIAISDGAVVDSASILGLADGGFVVAWGLFGDATDTSNYNVKAQLFNSAGAKVGGEFVLSASSVNGQMMPNLSPVAGGGFLATWMDYVGDGNSSCIKGQLFNAQGAKVGSEFVVNTTVAGQQLFPNAAMLTDGFVVTWQDSVPDGTHNGVAIRAQRFDSAGAKVGAELLVSTPSGAQVTPMVAGLAGGGFVVVWEHRGTRDVQAQIYDSAGAKVGGQLTVNTTTAQDQVQPAVAALPWGGFVVSWSDFSRGPDDPTGAIRAQIFEASGARSGGEFLVNRVTDHDQEEPALAVLTSGAFVASWTSKSAIGGDGSGYGIKAQIFTPGGAGLGTIDYSGDAGPVAINLAASLFLYPAGHPHASRSLAPGEALDGSGNYEFVSGTENFILTGGNDRVLGSQAANRIEAGGGDDIIDGAGGNDVLFGGAGNDRLGADAGDDQLSGEGGDDSLVAGPGFDTADGGTGLDTLVVMWGDVTRFVSTQNLTLGANGYSGSYIENNFIGPVERSVQFTAIDRFEITTGSGFDFITTGMGNDIVSSGAGNDSVDVGSGNDSADGGSGDDRLSADLSAASGAILYDLATGSYSGPVGAFSNFEGLGLFKTGSGDDRIVTTSLQFDERIETGAGNDQITVRSGRDMVVGGDGSDTLVVDYSAVTGSVVTSNSQTLPWGTLETGYNGTIDVGGGPRVDYSGIEHFEITATGAAQVHVQTGRGNDRIVTGAGWDRIAPGGGDDHVDAGAGTQDEIDYSQQRMDREAGTVGVIVNLSPDPYLILAGHPLAGQTVLSYQAIDNWGGRDTIIGIENAQSGNQDDVLLGNGVSNMFRAWGGNDRIVGGAGGDYLDAGDGVDLIDYSAEGGTNGVVVNMDGSGIFVSAPGQPQSLSPGQALDSFGHLDTLLGVEQVTTGAHADRVYGNAADNRISLGGGDDEAFGFAGADLLIGGEGDDSLSGGGGNDRLEGEEGFDFLVGGTGNDAIAGGGGDDIVRGDEGDDELAGGDGDDLLRGGDGVDSFDGGADSGGLSSSGLIADRISFFESRATQAVVADLRTGIISNDGFGNVETMSGIESLGADTAFADTFYGNDEANGFFAGRGDFLHGFGDDDRFEVRAAPAVVDGGAGTDILLLFSVGGFLVPDANGDGEAELAPAMTAGWNVNLAAGTLRDGYGNVGTVAGIENVSGSDLADEIRGDSGDNRLEGMAGNDLMLLQDGGSDNASGGEGNDVFYFGSTLSAGDVADGGEGRDAIVLQGNVTVVLSGTNLVDIESISLQSGANDRFGDTANNFYDFDVTTADGNVAAGVQLIVNAQSLRAGEDFTFDGSAETDGKFLIYAGHGTDILKGGAGVDVFFFEGNRWGPNDRVDGGAGRDAVVISGGTGLKRVEFGADSLVNIESISVNATLASDPTQKPSYELVLHNGNVAPGARLIVNGNSLADPAQTLSVDGSAVQDGHLTMFGGAGNDTLIGGAGGDLLYGGGGRDNLTGNAGADLFQWRASSESSVANPDSVLDFQGSVDKIDLSFIDADTLTAGNQAFRSIGSSAFTGGGAAGAGEMRVLNYQSYWVVEGDTDGNGVADFAITVITQGNVAMLHSDFIL